LIEAIPMMMMPAQEVKLFLSYIMGNQASRIWS